MNTATLFNMLADFSMSGNVSLMGIVIIVLLIVLIVVIYRRRP